MKRRAFLLAALAVAGPVRAAAKRFERGLLWRVSRKGLAPSHVYGTIHEPDARVSEMPARGINRRIRREPALASMHRLEIEVKRDLILEVTVVARASEERAEPVPQRVHE